MLSGPKALEDLRFLVAALSSEMEKGEVSIGRVSDTGTLRRVQLSLCSYEHAYDSPLPTLIEMSKMMVFPINISLFIFLVEIWLV